MDVFSTVLKLHEIIVPPLKPKDGGSDADWLRVEILLQRELPLDYKQILQSYGQGWFDSEFSFFYPFGGDILVDGKLECSLIYYNMNFREFMLKEDTLGKSYSTSKIVDKDYNVVDELTVWPKDNSVFWLAHHTSGFEIAYRAKGPTKDWTILISMGAHMYFEYPLTLSQYILSRTRDESDGIGNLFRPRDLDCPSLIVFNPFA